MVTNTRIFGHALSGVALLGGAHAVISNNVIGACSIAAKGAAPGLLVGAGVSDFIVNGNHIGDVFRGESSAATSYGVEVLSGPSDRYVVRGPIIN